MPRLIIVALVGALASCGLAPARGSAIYRCVDSLRVETEAMLRAAIGTADARTARAAHARASTGPVCIRVTASIAVDVVAHGTINIGATSGREIIIYGAPLPGDSGAAAGAHGRGNDGEHAHWPPRDDADDDHHGDDDEPVVSLTAAPPKRGANGGAVVAPPPPLLTVHAGAAVHLESLTLRHAAGVAAVGAAIVVRDGAPHNDVATVCWLLEVGPTFDRYL